MNRFIIVSYVLSFFFILSLSFGFLFPIEAQAQSDGSNLSIPGQVPDIQEQISVDVSPTIPKPGEEVTITIEAYGTDLNRANIVWQYNGATKLKGTGEKVFKFNVGKVGSRNAVNLTINPVNGPAITKTFSFTPAEIDLLWEASTYTPPFYKGKALFTPQSSVKLVALPNMIAGGSPVPASKTVYKWKIDQEVQGDKSGYGKNTFQYDSSVILRPHSITAEGYSSADPSVSGASKVTFDATDPEALIYEDHPLYGLLFNQALSNQFELTDQEKKLAAYPYFFSTLSKNNGLSYKWTINDNIITAPATQNTMRFQKTSQDSGTGDVRVVINNSDKFLQQASQRIFIFFNGSAASFGVQ